MTKGTSYTRLRRGGFTLIELMIVVAIVGVLAAIAIPQYQDYVARAQFTEALSLTTGQKAPLAEYYSEKGECPLNTGQSVGGIPMAVDISGRYVEKVEIVVAAASTGGKDPDPSPSCAMIASFRPKGISKGLEGKIVTVTMRHIDKGPIKWNCSSTALDRYVPQSCSADED
nr:pilin [uncultured Cupriavidus sp.]